MCFSARVQFLCLGHKRLIGAWKGEQARINSCIIRVCAIHGVTNNLSSQFGHAQKSVPMFGDTERRQLFDLYRPVTDVGKISHDRNKTQNKKSERYPSVEALNSVKARRTDCSAELSRKRHCPFASSGETAGLWFHPSVQTLALTDAPLPPLDGSVVSTP